MAFEDRTQSTLLTEMLALVTASVDKREGSIIYDTLAPTSIKLAESYIDLQSILDIVFPSTSTLSSTSTSNSFLESKVSERALTREAAVAAIRSGTFTGATPTEGTRFFTVDTNLFWSINSDGNLVCETAGDVGNNVATGTDLIPTTVVTGLTNSTLGDIVVAGADTENDIDLFNRYLENIRTPAENANANQYKVWANAFDGIGDSIIYPQGNGQNTVVVTIIGNDRRPASQTVIDNFQAYIDPTTSAGLGEGQAPIGHIVTVNTASLLAINISFTAVPSGSNTAQDIQTEAETVLGDYFESISFVESTVKYSSIFTQLIGLSTVTDIQNLLVAGGTANITLTETAANTQIPDVGTVTVNV